MYMNFGRYGHAACGHHRRYARDTADLEKEGWREHRSRHGRSGRNGRPLDYGQMRLLILALIAEQPRHGYDLIKAIEGRFAGTYTPSPGVIYPALAMLEEMGLIALDATPGGLTTGRKQYTITAEGQAQLYAGKGELESIMARMRASEQGRFGASMGIVRAMENVKVALRLRLAAGALGPEQAQAIADALDAAARSIERS